ncbi:hypothetical protein GGS21DRAFT_532512 [Xylaria nigripes]|nr:hypothetical protein GGS21DRAFT_532512 [Xylaria nigripes]
MADGEDYMRQDVSTRPHTGQGKARTRTRAPEPAAIVNSGNCKKAHRRPVNVTPSTSAEEIREARNHARLSANGSGSRPKSPQRDFAHAVDTLRAGHSDGLDISNWSVDAIPHPSIVKRDRENSGKGITAKLRKHANSISKPNAVSFLDADAPLAIPEGVHRATKESSKTSPDTAKSTLPSAHGTSLAASGFREDISDITPDHETDESISPERSADGVPKARMPNEAEPRTRMGKSRKQSYGTREMPRPNVSYPYGPPEEPPLRGQNLHFVEQLPRAEKLPLTGYDLLASKLSATSTDRGGRYLRPIYRRFEMLNHRMLLIFQDELCELEQQLQRIDMADTQSRRLPLQNGILPASRRAEAVSGTELQWHRENILWRIGFKLEQYNRLLSSFRETGSLSTPTMDDLQQYRGYLATHAPIVEAETEFLDATDDLICLGDNDEDKTKEEENAATPTSRPDPTDSHSRRRASVISVSEISSRRQDEGSIVSQDQNDAGIDSVSNRHSSIHLLVAAAVAIVLPILTFAVIPGFMGRMTVVCLVGMGITGTLVQGRMIGFRATQEFCVSVGLYGGVMALLAGMVN